MKKIFLPLLFVLSSFVNQAQVWKDVAPILFARCTSCHNPLGNGISFLTYSQTKMWAGSIQYDLNINRMPPHPTDSTYARYCHENLITPAEKTAILNWVTAGTPAGVDTTQAPPAPYYTRYKLAGTPNAVLQIPTFTSNAISTDAYNCFTLPTGLTQDVYLRAFEIVPGNPKIVHHVVINVDTAGTTTNSLTGSCYQQGGDFSIGGWAPGSPPTIFPGVGQAKMGIRIPAGSKLVLQIHYPAGSGGQIDSTKIRMYFYPIGTSGVRPVYVYTPLQYWNFTTPIPANAITSYTAKENAMTYTRSIYATFPHSHKVCKSITNYAYVPGDTVPIVRVNNWMFDFQGYYTFRNMKKVDNGYKIFSKHVYDNTVPHVPSPVATYWGFSTSNEMLFDGLMTLVYMPGDENINIQALLDADSLLMPQTAPPPNLNPHYVAFDSLNMPAAVGIKEINNNPMALNAYAFPNPFSNNVRIGYSLWVRSKVSVEIYSMYGTLVRTLQSSVEEQGVHEVIWDGKNDGGYAVAGGTYMYVVRSGNKQSYGKLSMLPSKD